MFVSTAGSELSFLNRQLVAVLAMYIPGES